ncbi:GGDEF domain-containing protein [Solihabitans fulvus]|uniref:GGDEF domain-containing protein n=1 Tax=Solihabitans fulvus TaxID=1892852 RepID=A0A5B2XD49_9PSEU|nr:GGDEF domain-containing protein [Solihabitans fulvus]KAA2260909.1 GGDEF domain-containing protein [Solihabitans fulvus]
MGVREIPSWRARLTRTRTTEDRLRALRSRWRTASIAAGWLFPSDWALTEVDAVCEAAITGGDLAKPLARLGRARADSGASLEETLRDLAAFHAVWSNPSFSTGMVSPNIDAMPASLLKVIALGWADAPGTPPAGCTSEDGLTGLVTPCYLRTRLAEVYREAEAAGREPGTDHVLVFVALDLSKAVGWSRLVAMALVADALRAVFAGGETLASVGPSVVAVLGRRDGLAESLANVRWLVKDKLAVDPNVQPTGPARIWLERLPDTHQAACDLLVRVGRS